MVLNKAMQDLFRKSPNQNISPIIQSIFFFAFFYTYIWLQVDTRLIYHGGGTITDFPIFFRGNEFLGQCLSQPGGAVEYLAAFLSAFLCYSWAGALIITLVAWAICACTHHFLKAIKATSLRWLGFLPAILLLISYTRYAYHFVTTVSFLVALSFACIYVRIKPKSMLAGFLFPAAISLILYAIAGGAYLFFALLCALYELFFRRRMDLFLLHFLLAFIIPYITGVLIFNTSVFDAFTNTLPFSWKIISYGQLRRMITVIYIIYLFLPATTLFVGSWRIMKAKSAENKPHLETFSWHRGKLLLTWVIETCLLIAVAAGAAYSSYNKKTKTLFEVDYLACQRKWQQVIYAAERFQNDYFIVHAVNRALYNTGRLANEAFSYPQNPYTLLLSAKEHRSAYWKKFGAYLDLGHINLAENALVESLENLGPRPEVLKQLAIINMVKGNINSARVYLGALSKTLFHAKWANNYLTKLDCDLNLSTDSRIQQLRTLMIREDRSINYPQEEQAFLDALEENRHNRMAFEYMMTWYLLTRQLNKFTGNINRLDDFDYSQIPRLYEEAMLTYLYRTKKVADLQTHRVSPETLQNFRGFMEILEGYGGDRDAAYNDIVKDYGESFFFYYIYGRSGMKK